MNSGLYAALSGAVSATDRIDTIANNLANANTTGFKKDRITFESVLTQSSTMAGKASDNPEFVSGRHITDFESGSLRQTGNKYDLAIEGDGFFTVQTPQGTAYTRQGSFRVDAAGNLITHDGYPLIGNGTAVRIPAGAKKVLIDLKGGILADGVQAGKIDIAEFRKPYQLMKSGAGFFQPTAGVQPTTATGTVAQGYLEESNISTVKEMVQMIDTNRHYEACTRVIRSFDDITGKAVNELGKV